MVNLTPIMIEDQPFTAVTVKLPKTNFMAVTNDHGYIMCGALDVALLNDKLKNGKSSPPEPSACGRSISFSKHRLNL